MTQRSDSLQSLEYWQKENKWFQQVYKDNVLQRIIHSPVKLREKLAVLAATLANVDTIIDLGCGQCSVLISAIRSSKATKGYGIDFSQKMISYANNEINKSGLASQVILEKRDVADDQAFPQADIAFALGLFDYVEPNKVISKAHEAAPVVVASWPERTARNMLRNFRYDCKVYKYKAHEVAALIRKCGADNVFLFDLGWNSGFATISVKK